MANDYLKKVQKGYKIQLKDGTSEAREFQKEEQLKREGQKPKEKPKSPEEFNAEVEQRRIEREKKKVQDAGDNITPKLEASSSGSILKKLEMPSSPNRKKKSKYMADVEQSEDDKNLW